MEFGLLGPLEVRSGGEFVSLRRGHPCTVLISLLLRAGHAVPVEVLIDHVWRDTTPANPTNALQVHVSYLRRALLPSAGDRAPALRCVAGGYVLEVAPEQVDLHRFESAVSSVTSGLTSPSRESVEIAAQEVAAALALWRGDPLSDVGDQPFVLVEIARLHELRAAALEHQVECQLLLGQHQKAAATLGHLIAEFPLRERLRAQLVCALYRCGRQADALRAFDATREMLVEELGIEPGPELQLLQHAVLAHDPSLDWEPLVAQGEDSQRHGMGVATSPPSSPALPASTTKLVGREAALVQLQGAMLEHRLVTLTGPGGAGKTRLALEAARAAASSRPVWLVELAEVGDPAVVEFEVARAVGVDTGTAPLDGVAIRVGDGPGLLVLDTCEHLIEACAALSNRLLRACPALSIVTTSRQVLGVVGEAAFPVWPLGVPAAGATFEDIARSDAVQLFCERSWAARPDFELTASNAGDVARLCRMIDGLPLAIELAAARTTVLTPARIVERLDDRFALLDHRGRAVDRRQQSLRTAIEWSYDLLDDEQQLFFRRLGVFAGRFTLEAAASVAGDGCSSDPLDLLSAVVERSLVVSVGDDTYHLLDTLRAFAVDRLEREPDHAGATRERMTQWLVARCEVIEPQLRGAEQLGALAKLEQELPNLRVALEWSFSAQAAPVGAHLACLLVWFWAIEGASEEATRWLRRATDVPHLDRATRARVFEGLGLHELLLGSLAAAQDSLQHSVDQWSALGEPHRGLLALIYLGYAQHALGEFDDAGRAQDRAIDVAREHGDTWGLAWALLWRSTTAAEQDDDARAYALLVESRPIAERCGDQRILGWIIKELGRAERHAGHVERALALEQEAVRLLEPIGSSGGRAAALTELGRALVAAGRLSDAIDPHRRAVQTALELGQPYAIAETLEGLADGAHANGDLVAAALLGAASSIRSQMGARRFQATRHGRSIAALEATLRDGLGPEEFAKAFSHGHGQAPCELVASLNR